MRWGLPCVAFVVLVFVPVSVASDSPGYSTEDLAIRAHDGVVLRATLFRPQGVGPFPALILPHGFPLNRGAEAAHAVHYAQHGWLALTYDARGLGQSGGLVSLDGPDEVDDVSILVSFLATRPDVRLDGPGDPHVGMRGASYGGAVQLLAAAHDPRIDALVPLITWNDLERALAPREVLKVGWVSLLFGCGQVSGHTGDTPCPPTASTPAFFHPNVESLDPQISQFYAEMMTTQEVSPQLRDYLRLRSPATYLSSVHAPTFLLQGWPDTLFDADEASATFSALRANGVATKLLYYAGGHGYDGTLSRATWEELEVRIDRWFDYWLDGKGTPEELFATPVEWWDAHGTSYVPEQAWTLADASKTVYYPVPGPAGGADGILSTSAPASAARTVGALGGLASLSEVPGFQGSLPFLVSGDIPATSVSYTTAALGTDQRFVGPGLLTMPVASTADRAFLFAKIFDVAPDGTAALVDTQVNPIRLGAADAGLGPGKPITLNLTAFGHSFPAGHRVRLVLATSDAGFAQNRVPGLVAFDTGPAAPARLELPLYPADRAEDVRLPLLSDFHIARDGANYTATVNARDDRSIATLLLAWRTETRSGVVAPINRVGDVYTFGFAAPGEIIEAHAFASDPSANRATNGASGLSGAFVGGGSGLGSIPTVGLQAALVATALGLAVVRRLWLR